MLQIRESIDQLEIALVSDVSHEVAYYMWCRDMNGKRTLQAFVWRSMIISHQDELSGSSWDIFQNNLLNTFNIAVSDDYQILEGKDFWIRHLGYALSFGCYVYRFNHRYISDNSCDLWRRAKSMKVFWP